MTERQLARLHVAQADSDRARMRLVTTLTEIQQRLTPKVLIAEARDELEQKAAELLDDGVAFAKERPGTVGAIVALLIAWLLRGPIIAAIASAFTRTRGNRSGGSRVDPGNATAAPSYQTRSVYDDR